MEVEEEEGRRERVEALPVDVLLVLADPGLEDALEFGVAVGRRQEVDVLVATRDVHLDLDTSQSQVSSKNEIKFKKKWRHCEINGDDCNSIDKNRSPSDAPFSSSIK